MAYTLPQFNLTCDVWNAGKNPANDDAVEESVPCQFYLYSRGVWPVQPCELELYQCPIYLRFPIDVAAIVALGQVFECPTGTGRYFRARFKEVMHYGFPNSYLVAIVVQCNENGSPMLHDIENAVPCDPAPPGDLTGSGEGSINSELIGLGEADNLGQ